MTDLDAPIPPTQDDTGGVALHLHPRALRGDRAPQPPRIEQVAPGRRSPRWVARPRRSAPPRRVWPPDRPAAAGPRVAAAARRRRPARRAASRPTRGSRRRSRRRGRRPHRPRSHPSPERPPRGCRAQPAARPGLRGGARPGPAGRRRDLPGRAGRRAPPAAAPGPWRAAKPAAAACAPAPRAGSRTWRRTRAGRSRAARWRRRPAAGPPDPPPGSGGRARGRAARGRYRRCPACRDADAGPGPGPPPRGPWRGPPAAPRRRRSGAAGSLPTPCSAGTPEPAGPARRGAAPRRARPPGRGAPPAAAAAGRGRSRKRRSRAACCGNPPARSMPVVGPRGGAQPDGRFRSKHLLRIAMPYEVAGRPQQRAARAPAHPTLTEFRCGAGPGAGLERSLLSSGRSEPRSGEGTSNVTPRGARVVGGVCLHIEPAKDRRPEPFMEERDLWVFASTPTRLR